jgi:hypothetical protein
MQNENSFCMQQLGCSKGGAMLPDAGVAKWMPGWSRRGGTNVRTVAEAVAEMMTGGRAEWKKEMKIYRGRGTGSRSGCSTTDEDLGSQGGCAVICWWRKKVSVGSSGAEDTVEREGREENVGWEPGNDWFLADFGPDFLLTQAMKCTPIYRRWKRDNVSLMVPNRGLWFDCKGSQPLVQSVHRELSNLQEKTVWVGLFRPGSVSR